MKRCPQCGREYDNTMMFCLDDGGELLYGPAQADEPRTAILSEPSASSGGGEAATRAQIQTTERTAVLPSGSASVYAVAPELDELRPDPRFKEMLKRLNLPE